MKWLGSLVLGTHKNPDFYKPMWRRAAPTLGESATQLRERITVNLERDQVSRSVAKRMIVFGLISAFFLSSFYDAPALIRLAYLQRKVDQKTEELRERIARIEEQKSGARQ